ncbi:ImmA/IrrE family metallo-endopeptidase [Salinisphaera sp. SWV1]|uniref:ImmA/IrrE family metallo-endopeptidase n=1 Tax=Salinisphaera sp. SWV1 TaxID=3454139 RepID=UPI003F875239
MLSNRRKEINSLATHLRAELNLSTPVDLKEAVEKLGGEIESFDERFGGNAEAYVRKRGESFAIAIKTPHEKRERFSIAHELGHLFLHLGYLVDDELWESAAQGYIDSVHHRMGYGEEEFEAHEFAGAFLMPASEFREVAEKNRNGRKYDLTKIAGHFDVSNMAAKTRGRWLRLFSWD